MGSGPEGTSLWLGHTPAGLWWSLDSRIIYALAEPPPNEADSNLWEVGVDLLTGQPSGKPKRITNWVGASISDPRGTADGKRLVFVKTTARQTSTLEIWK